MAKSKTKTIFVCQECGAQRPRWEGRCSECGAWNSLVEEIFATEQKNRGWSVGSEEGKTLETRGLDQGQNADKQAPIKRYSSRIEELDRVLGGGLVEGSFVLLGGAPGIGKSTITLQMAGGLASAGQKVLLISGEESVAQTISRANRLGVKSSLVQVAAESNLNLIMDLAKQKKPDILVIDSIQTVFLPEITSAPGSVSQVRECSGHLMALAKGHGMSIIIIGHVTKEGNLAGPKVLEHMVDCVLSFEGDISHQFRLLRSLKNRFGPTNELGVFRMNSEGLEEVANPSELFLEERGTNLVGSAIFASIEGSRPLLCEIQALTVETPMANPRRTALGVEVNRVHLLAAVLDRHLNLKLNQNDIFVNVVGGLRLEEPSVDLAVAAALISTCHRRPMDAKSVYFGEVGLTGEIRAVTFPDQRIKEAEKLGFETFVLPKSNERHLKNLKLGPGKRLLFVKHVNDLEQTIRNS